MDPRLIAALALAATATVDDVLHAIASRDDQLRIARESAKTAADQLKAFQLAETERTKTERAAFVTSKIKELRDAGKSKPDSEPEKALRRIAERDYELFVVSANDLLENGPRVTPVGAPLHVGVDKPPAERPGDALLAENPELANSLRKAGITKEQYEKHGARARANAEARRAVGL